jgi:hypothetical protein
LLLPGTKLPYIASFNRILNLHALYWYTRTKRFHIYMCSHSANIYNTLTHISPNYVIITHLPPLYFVEARMYERHAKQMRRYQTELDSSRQCGPKKAFLVHKQTVRNVNETSHESFLFKLACLI